MNFDLLSFLWLHEPDAETIARAVSELGLPSATPPELASAYTDVFLLNVPPYGTAFTDPDGELNAPEAQRVAALFESHGYCPPELSAVAAPDHAGLCLGFMEHTQEERGEWLAWLPVCCLAVEREPSARPFYRALAARTREFLLREFQISNLNLSNEHSAFSIQHSEISLRAIVRFFLAPARCGVFLSRSRLGQMAKELGVRLPFGSRFDVAEMLFASMGEAGQVERLIGALKAEAESWAGEYRAGAETFPAWQPFAEQWLGRVAEAMRVLDEMRRIVEAERI